MNAPTQLTQREDASASTAKCLVALRKSMLKLTMGGWAWSQKITVRLDRKLVVRLDVARDAESLPYDYTFEPGYAAQLVEIHGSMIRMLKVKTAMGELLMRVTDGIMKSPVFEFEDISGNTLVAIDTKLQAAWWRSAFLSSESGNLQISSGAVYISQVLPLELGIATMLYSNCRCS